MKTKTHIPNNMDILDTTQYPYARHCGALQGFLTMLPYCLCNEGILPIDSLKAAEKFVQEQMARIQKNVDECHKKEEDA